MEPSTPPVFKRHSVRFTSGNSYCEAWLYTPAQAANSLVPAVVMGHGLGATREMGLAPYAERFAAEGLAVLVFTYRGLGDSGGQPRQILSMPRQRADWHAAIDYVRTNASVDPSRIAIWGSSLGGGHALAVAAERPELAAVVSQCPFTDGLASAAALGVRRSLAFSGVITRDLVASARGKAPVTIPVAGEPGELALMNAPDALPGMLALLPDSYEWVNAAAARSVLSLIRYRPGRAARRISAPTLICISATDSVAPPGPTEKYARQAPRGDVRRYDAGHFDFYRQPAFTKLVDDQAEFLLRHLHPQPATNTRPTGNRTA